MKKSLILSLILLVSTDFFGQTPEFPGKSPMDKTAHSFLDAAISVSPTVLFRTPNGITPAGGLKIRMFLGKRFSFDSDLVIGKNYFHLGPGIIGLPLWYFGSGLILENDTPLSFDSFDNEEGSLPIWLFLGAVMLTSAEHFAYHFPLDSKTDISPYVSFLRIKQIPAKKYPDGKDDVVTPACFAMGMEINKYFNRFVLSPYIDYDISYKGHHFGLNAGVYFGYCFSN